MTVPAGTESASEPSRPAAHHAPPEPAGSPEPVSLEPSARPRAPASAREAVAETCPYLTSAGGAWRSASPSRDHRCGAVEPPSPQTSDKQRRHCLSADHVDCSMFRAARSARATALAAGSDPALVAAADDRRRPVARTAPVLLEPPRIVDQAVRLQFDRAPSQIALVALMVVAFGIVALARLSAGASPAPSASPSAFAVLPSPSPSPTPRPSASPSPEPSASPSLSVRTTYRVKRGDTLVAIAKRFGTSVTKIRALNGMTSSAIKIGQVLKIP
jgi:nucleoid-associated protein YgaU